jgi:hypothetical protein
MKQLIWWMKRKLVEENPVDERPSLHELRWRYYSRGGFYDESLFNWLISMGSWHSNSNGYEWFVPAYLGLTKKEIIGQLSTVSIGHQPSTKRKRN